MLSQRSDAKLAHGLAALRACQLLGPSEDDSETVPEPGQVSRRYLARVCGLSRDTVQAFEEQALRQLADALIAEGISPEAAEAVFTLLDADEENTAA